MTDHAGLVALLRKHKATGKFRLAVMAANGWKRDHRTGHDDWYTNWPTIAPAIAAAFDEVFDGNES